jgi:hypothetical protein
MISTEKPIPTSTIQQTRPSSLGALDALPLELLFCALDYLDLRSLSRLSRGSHRGKSVVDSLPALRDIRDHAPCTFPALRLTGLIHVHSVGTLRATLRSEQCVSCREYGPFLFLPTAERCCCDCLEHNPSLWVIPMFLAMRCFGLTLRQLKRIPIMHACNITTGPIPRRGRSLVSVKMAKELSIRMQVSIYENPRTRIGERKEADMKALQWFRDASLQPLPKPPSKLLRDKNAQSNPYQGAASIPFPSLPAVGHTAENGLWCRGCDWLFDRYAWGELDSRVIRDLGSSGGNVWYSDTLRRRARSKEDFAKHLLHCYGTHQLEPSLAGCLE